ncbi:MAG: hypothetical protein LBH46_02065 [Rickettsiales bacterium]|jgi:hypothetical protein|nr:hypothetical protein [Rickettsiales bacterium]
MKKVFLLFLFISNAFSVEVVKRNSVNLTELREKYQTLMFTQKQIHSIFDILIHNSNVGTNLSSANSNKQYAKIDEENFYFYLKSIVYSSPNSWTIFVNDKRITDSDRRYDDKVTILKVSPNYVTFLWTGTIPEINTMNYNDTIPEDKYKIENDEVKMPFRLSLHQTFLPLEYKIIEGKGLPDTDVNDTPEEKELKIKQKLQATPMEENTLENFFLDW